MSYISRRQTLFRLSRQQAARVVVELLCGWKYWLGALARKFLDITLGEAELSGLWHCGSAQSYVRRHVILNFPTDNNCQQMRRDSGKLPNV
jgi:hypothetical protein